MTSVQVVGFFMQRLIYGSFMCHIRYSPNMWMPLSTTPPVFDLERRESSIYSIFIMKHNILWSYEQFSYVNYYLKPVRPWNTNCRACVANWIFFAPLHSMSILLFVSPISKAPTNCHELPLRSMTRSSWIINNQSTAFSEFSYVLFACLFCHSCKIIFVEARTLRHIIL